MSRCCPRYVYGLCLYPNAAQTAEDGDYEVTIAEGTLYAPTEDAANCLALEIANDRVFDLVCENSVPVADPQELVTDLNTPINITLTGTSPTGGFLLFTVTVFPTNGILVGDEDSWIYTPTPGYSGPDSFEFTVFDGQASEPATVSITVLPTEEWTTAFNVTIPDNYCDDCGCDDLLRCYRLQCARAVVFTAQIVAGNLYLPAEETYRVRRWANSAYGSGNPSGTVIYTDADGDYIAHGVNAVSWTMNSTEEDTIIAAVEAVSPGYGEPFTLLCQVLTFIPECIPGFGTSSIATVQAFFNGWTGMEAVLQSGFITAHGGTTFFIQNGAAVDVTADFVGAFPAEVADATLDYVAANWYAQYLTNPTYYEGLTIFFDSNILSERGECDPEPQIRYLVTARATSLSQD